ncbi:nucleotidyltransferase family protein [Aliiroseovarius sp. 2305UL8-7]|uniref:nucleotidyltransferase family protein n=1 Tax=Aliiroseovarius conchicola TaxID=3121637 RepID=UPI00352741E7
MGTPPNIAILIMAAGQSRRMGRDKLMLRAEGGPALLEDRLHVALRTDSVVYAAVGADQSARQACIQATQATLVICNDAHRGLGHSLSQAIAMLPEGLDGVVILLADMPAITTGDILKVRECFNPGLIARGAMTDGTPGHPVLFPKRYFASLTALEGDQGAQSVVKGAPTKLASLPEDHAILDIDTPEDWDLWIQRRGERALPSDDH